MKKVLFTPCLLLLCKFLFAQTPAQSSFNVGNQTMAKQPENYIAPIRAIKRIKTNTADFIGLNTWQQAMMTWYSFLGDYGKSLYYSDSRFKDQLDSTPIVHDTIFLKEHQLVDATDYVINESKLHQVIMINEAHHLAYHRVFAISVLNRLYDAGFHCLAIEAIEDSLINQKKYPDYNTGLYTSEPLFGELIRQAKKIGFTLVGYDFNTDCEEKNNDPNYCNRYRDSIMAVNLTKLLKKDPKTKILIYAGYDHIYKGSTDSWKKMAQYFKEFNGIDPFSIELTRQVEHMHIQFDEDQFLVVNKFKHIKRPVIALKDGKPWHTDFVDATVIFPAYLVNNKRPSFYSINGLRTRYNLNKLHLKSGQFVQSFYSNEKPGKRIPADQLIISKGENILYLFKGKYILAIKNKNGDLIKEHKISIN